MRRLLLLALALVLPAGVPVAIGYRSATSDPLVRRASVSLTDWPADAAPVTIALLSDVHIGNAAMDRDRFARVATAVTALKPDLIVLAGDFIAKHEPSDAAAAAELAAGLVLAGHTHCGQMLLPFYGAPVTVSRYGDRYLCGVVREGAQTTIVTAGVGTSLLPLRWGVPPDLWLVRVGP